MATLSTGTITWEQIQAEYGGSNPIGLNEYYGRDGGIPGSGTISASHFHGQTRDIYFSMGGYSHNSHPHNPSGAWGDKSFQNKAISHNHTVGTLNVPQAGTLIKIWIKSGTGTNVSDYINGIFLGGTQIWSGNVNEFSNSGDGTEINTTDIHFGTGNHSVRIDTYAAHENNDRLYIDQIKFHFRHD